MTPGTQPVVIAACCLAAQQPVLLLSHVYFGSQLAHPCAELPEALGLVLELFITELDVSKLHSAEKITLASKVSFEMSMPIKIFFISLSHI